MARCAMCDAEATATLYDGVRDHYGVAVETFRFVRCAACGSGTLDPTPPPATLAALYSPSYTFKAGGDAVVGRVAAALEWRLFYLPAYHRRVALVRRLTGLESGRVLEVGCGSGLFLRCLADAGYVVEGAETSKVDAEHARERLGLTVHHGTVEDLALPAGRFDAVLLLYVLEHIPDPARTLAEIRRILVPGGSVVLGLPVLDSGQGRLLGARWSAVTEAPRHVSLPSFDGARRLLTRAGFRDVRAAPAPLFENAGHVALSLLPAAATPRSHAGGTVLSRVVRRAAGAALLLPGLAVAAAERVTGRTGTMLFCGRT